MNQNINPLKSCQAVYPLLALNELQGQARQVDRLVYARLEREVGELSCEDAKPRQQAETDLSLNLVRTIGEAFYGKNLAQPNAPENPSAQQKNADMPVYRNVPFSLVLRLTHHLGLPLSGEISRYRQMAFFAPVLDALDEKAMDVAVELIQLLILTTATRNFQEIKPVSKEFIRNEIAGFIELVLSRLD